MGTNLVTGIVQDITIRKNTIESRITIDQIIKTLEEEQNINFSCYDYHESSEAHYWKIQPRMLEGNFVEFLEAQACMYGSRSTQDAIDAVRAVKTGNQLIALAAKKCFVNFQLVDNLLEFITIDYMHLRIEYRMIGFFIDGKIIMDCYGHIFNYFEKIIRLQKSKYPVVDCVKVLITC